METKISVVINTLNEAANIERAIKSVSWADEIIVCDMQSDDDTAVIAKKLGAIIIFHKRLPFVEPARNFAISKTTNDWVLVLDPDEEIPETLQKKLQQIASSHSVTTFVEIPRKNIIFGKWVKSAMWWPDYNIRFFKKGNVTWSNKIHRQPQTEGQGLKLAIDEQLAIVHHHYDSIDQFLIRMNRYSTVQAKELRDSGYKFSWLDLIDKPLSEFLSRFFALRGFEDGLHGLALSFLQAFSFLIVYLKVWEMEKFNEQPINLKQLSIQSEKSGQDIKYWFQTSQLSRNKFKRLLQKAKNRISQ